MIAVADIEYSIAYCFRLKESITELKKQLSSLEAELEEKQMHISELLISLEKDSYHSNAGIFSFREVESFRVPKDDLSRELFFNFLKDRGIFDQMITVNSQTLNAFAKQEIEAHKSAGNIEEVIDYIIPGIEKGQAYRRFTMRKA